MDIFSCHLKFDECALRHYRPHDNTTGADKGEGTSGGLNFFDRFRNFKDSSVFRMSLLILTAPSACYTLFCEYFGGVYSAVFMTLQPCFPLILQYIFLH